jgi:hypothetical protein
MASLDTQAVQSFQHSRPSVEWRKTRQHTADSQRSGSRRRLQLFRRGLHRHKQALLDVTQEPFPKLLHDTVLAPIGMTRSTYEQPLPQNLRDNAATPYRRDGKPIEGGAHTYPELAAAGLWTTPTDIARFAIEVDRSLNGNANHVLSKDMTRQMLTAGMGHWGLGLEIGGSDANLYFAHGGDNAGFHNNFVLYEKSGNGFVVMTNGDNGNLLADEIMHSVANEYSWADFRPTVRASIHVDPKVLATYAGSYESKDFNLVVTVENGQLMVRAHGQTFPLYAENETRFFFTVSPEDLDFVKDEQGNVTSLVLQRMARTSRRRNNSCLEIVGTVRVLLRGRRHVRLRAHGANLQWLRDRPSSSRIESFRIQSHF